MYREREGKDRVPRAVRVVAVYVLFVLLGLFPFLLINAVFAELGALVDHFRQPAIGSWLGTAFQVANIVSLVYVSLSSVLRVPDGASMAALQVLAVADCLLLALLWWWEAGGLPVGVLLLTFVAGIVGCTGVVFLYASVSHFGPLCIAATNVGMSLSGGVTSVLSLVQTYVPHFSVSLYMLLCCGALAASLAATAAIALLRTRLLELKTTAAGAEEEEDDDDDDEQKYQQQQEEEEEDGTKHLLLQSPQSTVSHYQQEEQEYGVERQEDREEESAAVVFEIDPVISAAHKAPSLQQYGGPSPPPPLRPHQRLWSAVLSMASTLWAIVRQALSAYVAITLNGAITYFLTPGIQPYLAMTSEGEPDQELLKWISNTFLICNIFGGLVTSVPMLRIRYILMASAVEVAIAGWLIVAALLNNLTSVLGGASTLLGISYVACYGLQSFLSSYINTMAYIKVRESVDKAHVPQAAKLASVSYQLCCMLGTLLCLAFTSVAFP